MVQIPKFKNPQLLTQALTHRSYFNEHPQEGEDNERLEFLGDAVLKFVTTKLLYERYPHLREGELTRLRAALENNKNQLAELAKKLKLDRLIRLGKGAELEGNRQNSELLGDVFEAFIAAYFLDSGLEALCDFLEVLLIPFAEQFSTKSSVKVNLKGQFQEWALANLGENPEYFIVNESGLEHAKVFTAEVRVKDRVYGVGKGKSKKIAEKNAVEVALRNLNNPVITQPSNLNRETQDDIRTIKLNILKQISRQMNKNICENCSDPSYCLAHNTCLIKETGNGE
jgi:ribonuclease-3